MYSPIIMFRNTVKSITKKLSIGRLFFLNLNIFVKRYQLCVIKIRSIFFVSMAIREFNVRYLTPTNTEL